MNIDGQIENKLKLLRLTGMLESLAVRVQQAEKSHSEYREFLMTLLEDEYERRQARSLLKRLKKAGFEEEKTLEGFDFSFNPQIPAKRIKAFANCCYIDRNENVFLLGPVGVGKTHIAQALGHIACRMGYEVLFSQAARMFRYLHGGRADQSWEKRFKRYVSVPVLILDDFGLKPLTPTQSDDFYELVSERYMKHATIFTSSRDLVEWPGLFADPIIANSVMDRIAHNAHQIIMTGESYRNQGARANQQDGKYRQ